MKQDFETKFTGWAFIIAAIFLLLGQELSPHRVAEFFVPSDFNAIGENLWYWIWMYRIHLFGWVIMAIALFSFATMTNKKPYRIVLMPGIGITIAGIFVMALGAAFYYTYGAWGSGKIADMNPAELSVFMNDLTITNQYFTCLVRFGRIFPGAGLALIGVGLFTWRIVPKWIGGFTFILGMVAMCTILFISDNFEAYKPIFYVKVAWLIIMGATLLKNGINLPEEE